MKPLGRRRAYTEIGIQRVPCARCGRPSSQQWQICANDNYYRGVCEECDIELNRTVLEFFRFPDVADRLKCYGQQLRRV